jgi:hypothetical protein
MGGEGQIRFRKTVRGGQTLYMSDKMDKDMKTRASCRIRVDGAS